MLPWSPLARGRLTRDWDDATTSDRPIVGVTKTRHLDDAIASLRITLTDAELAMLTDRYVPRLPEGFE